MKKALMTTIVVLPILAGSIYFLTNRQPLQTLPQNEGTINSPDTEASEFLDTNAPLPSALMSLKETIASRIGYDPEQVKFYAITPDTILLSVGAHTGENFCIFDITANAKTCDFISSRGVYSFRAGDRMVFIDADKISYYKLGQQSFTPLSESDISSPLTYRSGVADMPAVIPVETHTNNSLTVTVFDSSQLVPSPNKEGNIFKKVRDITILLP